MNAAEKQRNETQDDELYLIDGSGFIFRAYYAMAYSGQKAMTNPEGVPIGAVFGFTNMLLKLLQDYHAPYIAVIFDAARKNFRNDIYPDYKANRDETPEDLIPQFPLVKKATKAFDIPAIELEGFEADDLIAAYAKLAKEQGKKVVIVSSDKDLMQLVDDDVRMLDPMKNKWIGEKEVIGKFGVKPNRVVDVQSLAGDSSDNVPGVPGIGIKTAAQLINEYGDLESLLNRAGEIKQPKRRENLIESADMARISKKLVRLDEDAPVPVALADLKTRDGNHPDLFGFLQAQGFNSILKRLGGEIKTAEDAPKITHANDEEALSPIKDNQYTLITDSETLKTWIAEADETGILAIDTETTSLTPAKAKLVGISISSKPGKAAYIPLGHTQSTDLFGESSDADTKQMKMDEAIKLLKPILEDESVLKIGHNMKYDWQMLAKQGVRMHPCDDTMLISYVLDGTAHSHSMDNLAMQLFAHQNIKFEEVAGKGKNRISFDQVPIETALDYAAEDA
ncbi:MAG TPA: DNA polymerase I, partial [Hellea balneolensis]|nr:DNA polymerase I [Hellea balneolensis]